MPQSLDAALDYSQRWLEIIRKAEISVEEGKVIIEETVSNFAEHFNRGWLDYRKSVTEAGDWAVTEWSGQGALFRDVLGREFIDCLGAFGMMNHGWGHPEIGAAAGSARPIDGRDHAGRPLLQLLCSQRHGSH